MGRMAQAGQAHSLSAIHEAEAEFEALFDDPWDRLAMRQDLVTAIQTLPRIYQEVLYLHYGKDMQVSAIAQSLDEKEGTIRSRLSRARDLLRAYFDIALEEREGDRRHV